MSDAPQRFTQYVIYEHPLDYPAGFIVREWYIADDGTMEPGPALAAATLEHARALLPEGSVQTASRDPDDPVISEVWL